MFKKELRKFYKSKRSSLTNNEIEALSLSLANMVLKLDIWECSNYHIFFPIEKNSEIDTKLIIQVIQGKDKNVILPKLNLENKSFLNFLLTDATSLKENNFGIAEPQSGIQINENQIEVVFVPLLCFDKSGHRVGYGGGYYDRFLKKCSENTIKIGVSFFDPIEKIIDININDIKMNYCLTPNKIYEF
ncbi:5-formyltetrahydrofolate cyclo-ligase [Flavobacteriaceae bacterium]|nr:5-formyltetrahydrofolate cyclo-ligase [Flavobacteriaceae bacterium]